MTAAERQRKRRAQLGVTKRAESNVTEQAVTELAALLPQSDKDLAAMLFEQLGSAQARLLAQGLLTLAIRHDIGAPVDFYERHADTCRMIGWFCHRFSPAGPAGPA